LEVLREQRFAFRQRDTVLTGVFDRLVICRRGAKVVYAEVLDFKTDRVDPSDTIALRDRVEFYRPQMEAYRHAAARFTGLEAERIGVKLLFVAVGQVCSV